MKLKVYIYNVLLFLLISGCGGLEMHFFTRVNLDGSIYKRVTAVGDSSAVYRKPFSFDVNDGWELSYKKEVIKSGEDTLFYVIAEQTFESVNDLNRVMYSEEDTMDLKENIRVSLNKKFRWFFTFNEYQEMYIQRFPYRHLKLDDFLTNAEQAYFFNNDSTVLGGMTKYEINAFEKQGEEKWQTFLMSSINMEYIRLINEYAVIHDYEIPDEQFSEIMAEVFTSAFDDGPDLPGICQIADSLLNKPWVYKAYEEGYFMNFERQLEHEVVLLDGRKYVVEVDAPGIIYQTNADFLDENIVKWQFKGSMFAYKDFITQVSYRTTNWWAIIITLVFTVIFVIYAFRFSQKRKI